MMQRTKRELLSPLVVGLGATLVFAACSADSPEVSVDPTDSGPTDSGPRTTATPTTLPTATTDPVATDPDATAPRTTDRDTTNPGAGPQGFSSAKLSFFGDCPALLEYMQTEASERVTAWGFGGGFSPMGGDEMAQTTADVAGAPTAEGGERDMASAEAPAAVEEAPGGFSETNTQEVGVDEGDIVETDGEYVYVANSDGLRIVSVADADVVDEPDLPDGSHQLLLDGDRLLVVTSAWTGSADTIVSLFDVSDPSDTELLRRSHLEGSVVATRSVDDVARLVITTSFDQRLPFVQPSQFGLDEERALERNQQIIEESTVEDWLPRWFDEAGDGSFGPMQPALDCNTVAAPDDFAGLGLTWIASVDMLGEATPVGSAGIVSTGDTVYASTDNLYISTMNWDWQFGRPMPVDQTVDSEFVEETGPPTLIHQFALGEGTAANYVASGQVPGRLLNQFAMSEHNGDLRVATTTEGWNFGEQSESAVYVLRPNGESLDVIGSVGGLGKTETIRSVRFLGDTGYVVTFRQTDPLYVIDLTDPANPILDGELKIPGYSAYLHPVGDGLLLGVGQDATETGQTLGTQLSLFDVSDPTNPQRIDTLEIGGTSEVEWDHKAFLFWPEDGTIVLPVSPGWNDCRSSDVCLADEIQNSSGGVIVAQLDGRELSARGTISHSNNGNSGCWNPLQRSMVIGSELVTIGLDQMKFSDRQTLETRDGVSWGDPEQYGCYYYLD